MQLLLGTPALRTSAAHRLGTPQYHDNPQRVEKKTRGMGMLPLGFLPLRKREEITIIGVKN
jgi:hypothetical protein